jgi:hypothetical protein
MFGLLLTQHSVDYLSQSITAVGLNCGIHIIRRRRMVELHLQFSFYPRTFGLNETRVIDGVAVDGAFGLRARQKREQSEHY